MFCQSNLLFGRSDEKFRGRNAKFQAPEFFFRGLEFLFRGSYEKIPLQKLFCGGLGAVFSSRWSFFTCKFSVSFCRRNPCPCFPAFRSPASGMPCISSGRQENGVSCDTLIPVHRAWLCFFHPIPGLWPNTRISEGEKWHFVNVPPDVHSVSCHFVSKMNRAHGGIIC